MSATQKSAKSYREITKDEFEAMLEDAMLNYEQQNYNWAREYIYEAPIRKGEYFVRVYSSIDERNDNGRENGDDAIRMVVFRSEYEADDGETIPETPIHKKSRTNRIQTYQKNFYKKEREIITDFDSHVPECPDCGGPMIARTNNESGEKFLGCIEYPNCFGTRDF